MGVTTWIKVTIGLAVLANVLQLVGFVAPMWIWLDVDTFTVGVGLWYTTGCGLKGTCNLGNTTAYPVSFGYTSADTYAQHTFRAVQILETFGFAGGMLVLVFLIFYRFGYGKWTHLPRLNHAAFGTSIITWLCILTGVIVFCGNYWPVVGTSPLHSSNSFPWSMLMCVFAGILFIIVCVLIRLKYQSSEFVQNAIPTSGDSKMDLHPVTKQGLFQRYFAPAVHETRRPNYAANFHNTGFGMNGLMIGARDEPRRSASTDNLGFEGNGSQNGINYRYVPAVQDGATHGPTLPTSLFYTDINPKELNRFRSVDSEYASAAIPAGLTHVAYPSASRDVVISRYPNGGVTRDISGFSDGAMTRDVANQARYTPSPRQSVPSILYGNVTAATSPIVTQTKSSVAGLTDQPRGANLANNVLGGGRVTNYGRLMANTDYLSTDFRGGDRVLPQLGLTSNGITQQYITTPGQFSPPPRYVAPLATTVGMYDPPLIYKSRTEEMY